jgi:hypothetical protein
LIISSRGDVPGPKKNASILTADRNRNPSAPYSSSCSSSFSSSWDQDYFNPHRSSESQIHLAACACSCPLHTCFSLGLLVIKAYLHGHFVTATYSPRWALHDWSTYCSLFCQQKMQNSPMP